MPHARESSSRSPSSPSPPRVGEDYYLEALAAEKDDSRGLRRALFVAAAVHVLLLAVTLPELTPRTLAAESEPELVRRSPWTASLDPGLTPRAGLGGRPSDA